MAIEMEDGALLTTGAMRQLAKGTRENAPPPDATWVALIMAAALFEALAKTKDDLAAAVETAAQLRREFEALKSQIVRQGR